MSSLRERMEKLRQQRDTVASQEKLENQAIENRNAASREKIATQYLELLNSIGVHTALAEINSDLLKNRGKLQVSTNPENYDASISLSWHTGTKDNTFLAKLGFGPSANSETGAPPMDHLEISYPGDQEDHARSLIFVKVSDGLFKITGGRIMETLEDSTSYKSFHHDNYHGRIIPIDKIREAVEKKLVAVCLDLDNQRLF